MEKTKLILHLGLPKTATTTLQNNLLMPLHERGEINFLGRFGSGVSNGYFNPFESVYNHIKYENFDYASAKKSLQKIINPFVLNVVSEESLSITENEIFNTILKNLSLLLSDDYETTVLLSIRSPVDFINSYYIEQYRWHYTKKKTNTLEKYVNEIIKNSEESRYSMFFYDKFIDEIREYFPSIKVMFFEDVKFDKKKYTIDVAELLGLEVMVAKDMLFKSVENSSLGGKLSRAVTLSQVIQRLKSKVEKKINLNDLKKISILRKSFRRLVKIFSLIVIIPRREHVAISEELETKLIEKVGIKNIQKFSIENNLDLKKIVSYRYSVPKKTNISHVQD